MTKIDLTDTFVLDGVRRTADGYLTAFARVARTGIQVYRGRELGRPDLDTVRVYRPPEEVFSADAMRSFAHRPVTRDHPPTQVNAKNWTKYARGQTGDEVVRDGEFIRVPLVLMDQGVIDAYEKSGVKELSMGYSAEIVWKDGVTESGETYNAVQTAIRGNHLAVVPVARGGDQLRIGDGAKCPECGAEMQGNKCPECNYVKDQQGEQKMKTIIVDGLSVQVADDQSASIIQRVLDAGTAALKKVTDEFEAFKKKKKEDDDESEKKMKDAQTAISAKDGEIVVLKKQVADAEVTPAKLDALVKDRLSVIDAAVKLLPKEFAFDGKTIAEIKRAAVDAKLGDAAKGLDDAAVGGAFAALSAGAKDDAGTRPIRDAFAGHRPGNVQTADADKAHAEMTKRIQDAWKTPSAAA